MYVYVDIAQPSQVSDSAFSSYNMELISSHLPLPIVPVFDLSRVEKPATAL